VKNFIGGMNTAALEDYLCPDRQQPCSAGWFLPDGFFLIPVATLRSSGNGISLQF
jgi:hypothetical protein